jgi:uncharacterized protein (TIGR03086 family)
MTTPDATPAPQGDPRPAFFAAADQLVVLIGDLTLADLTRPTPCDDYDVRALVGHVLAVFRRITHVATGGSYTDVPQVVTGVDDEALAQVAHADRDRLVQTWGDDAVLDRVLTLPPGVQLPGRVGAVRYTQEMVTHAWDLATALGRADRLDDALAAPLVPMARRFIPREGREHFPFGEVVDVAEGASPYARLVAWLGRDPSWSPPN